jgi:hypothetical protein
MNPDNPVQLRALIEEFGLTRPAVAELLGVERVTVNSWLAPVGSPSHRAMPDNLLRLAMLELGKARRRKLPPPKHRKPAVPDQPEA